MRALGAASTVVMGVVSITLAIAGAGKLLALDAAIDDATSFTAIELPKSVLGGTLLLLACAEGAVGLAWFGLGSRRFAQFGTLALLCLLIAGLTYQLRYSNPPKCACFGLLQRFDSLATDARGALHRAWWLLGLYSAAWTASAWSHSPRVADGTGGSA